MATLYERGSRLSKNVIFSFFSDKATKLLGAPFKVLLVVNEVADKLADKQAKDNKFKQLLGSALTVGRLVRAFVQGEYRSIKLTTIVSGLAVLLYVLSPIDLIPDGIPVLGWLDDLSIISWFVGKFQGELLRFREWEATAASALPTPEPASPNLSLPPVAELGHS